MAKLHIRLFQGFLIVIMSLLLEQQSVVAKPVRSFCTCPCTTKPQIAPPATPPAKDELLPVGLIVNGLLKSESLFVVGQENGLTGIRFEDWQVPFDEISTAVGFKIKEVNDQLEISIPGQRFRIPVKAITLHPKLGPVISIRDLTIASGFKIEFDINRYAIVITTPVGDGGTYRVVEPPIDLEGLPTVAPRGLGFNIVQQRLGLTGTPGTANLANAQGELQAAGNAADFGWYLRLNQPTIGNSHNWNFSEIVALRQRNDQDLILGSQSPFWRYRINNNGGTYWAGTVVQRNGFDPPVNFGSGGYVLQERLQAKRTSRTISGLADPGTLVRLVRNDRNQLIQEVLVDSSGVYRFDNIAVSGNLDDAAIGRDFKVFLYPGGQLVANPIVRDISFTSFYGQIPVGAEAWVFSAGANRVAAGNFGTFNELQGGVLYRRGITDALTLGAGVAYDREVRGVGELFWQPSQSLDISAAATTGSKNWDHIARLNYRPSQNFYLNATSDLLSTSANTYWRLGTNFAAISSYESRRGTALGGEYFSSSLNQSTLLRGDVDDQGRIRLAANQRWQNWEANYNSNEAGINGQISYRPEGSDYGSGHEFLAGYQRSRSAASSQLISTVWRYRSPDRAPDGRNLWQTELGYGFNGLGGSGILAAADLNLIPGFQIRTSYRGVSDSSTQGSYGIELTTTLLTGGTGSIRGTYDRVEDFRSMGKVMFRPFLDKNQNGRQDPGEENYWDPLLLRINDKPLTNFRPQVVNNQADLNLPSGNYRVDIDPAGYPIDARSRTNAVRVDVVIGGITEVPIPLVPAYLVTGFVKDQKGNAVAGARVEAINPQTKTKVSSITNDSGFYTLEGLEQGEYQLLIGGIPSNPGRIIINPQSQSSQTLNLQVTIPEEAPVPPPTPERPSAPATPVKAVPDKLSVSTAPVADVPDKLPASTAPVVDVPDKLPASTAPVADVPDKLSASTAPVADVPADQPSTSTAPVADLPTSPLNPATIDPATVAKHLNQKDRLLKAGFAFSAPESAPDQQPQSSIRADEQASSSIIPKP